MRNEGKITPNMVELYPLPEGVTAKVVHHRTPEECRSIRDMRYIAHGNVMVPAFATEVWLYRPDVVEPIGYGRSMCNTVDGWTGASRRVGHAIARNRALKNAYMKGHLINTRTRGVYELNPHRVGVGIIESDGGRYMGEAYAQATA